MHGVNGDHIGTPDYVVTSVADEIEPLNDDYAFSVREAVMDANGTAGAEEIWLPARSFALTIDRGTNPTDTTAAYGDLDISDSLTIRGVNGATNVAWRTGVVDKVFELLGDYNGNRIVDAADYTVWRDTLGVGSADPAHWEQYAADGDDDGDVDQDDYDIWGSHFGNTLSLLGVS